MACFRGECDSEVAILRAKLLRNGNIQLQPTKRVEETGFYQVGLLLIGGGKIYDIFEDWAVDCRATLLAERQMRIRTRKINTILK